MSVRIAAGPRRVEPRAIESELEKLWIAMPRTGGTAVSASMTMRAVMAGWLKAQMDKSGHSLPRERIHLIFADPAGFSFRSLMMTCSGVGNTFIVTRSDDCMLEARAMLGAQVWSNVIKASCPGVDKLLTDEIALSGRDAVFETALAAAVSL